MAEPLVGGTFIDVTLEFAKAGKTTISVPVRPGDLDLANREELRDPYEH
jgi:copper(I)-binding protein